MAACPGCQRPVTEGDRAVLQVRLEGSDFEAHERGKRVRAGASWVGALALLFAIAAPLMFVVQKMQVDKVLVDLDKFEDDEELAPIDGKTYTAGELRREVTRGPVQALVVNLILAGLMALLWIWAKRAPLPAIACALALYLVVQLVSAVIDPTSILKGIIIKLLAFLALGKGLKAALDARTTHRPAV
jgi:hypothetical protein